MPIHEHDVFRLARRRHHNRRNMDPLYQLSANAAFFEQLPLECDGMVSVASAVLARDGISHQAMCGRLTVEDVGTIPVHCWIAFPSGQILDLCARMWLGTDARVPHGLFQAEGGTHYGPSRTFDPRLSASVFMVLTGQPLASAPLLLTPR